MKPLCLAGSIRSAVMLLCCNKLSNCCKVMYLPYIFILCVLRTIVLKVLRLCKCWARLAWINLFLFLHNCNITMQVCLLKGHKLHYLYCVFLLKYPFKTYFNCLDISMIRCLGDFAFSLCVVSGYRPVVKIHIIWDKYTYLKSRSDSYFAMLLPSK